MRNARVVPEVELRGDAESQRATELGAEVPRHGLETLHRGRLLGLGPQDAHVDLGMAEVASHFHTGHGDKPRDTRVLHALGEEHRDRFPDRLGNTIWTSGIRWHESVGSGWPS